MLVAFSKSLTLNSLLVSSPHPQHTSRSLNLEEQQEKPIKFLEFLPPYHVPNMAIQEKRLTPSDVEPLVEHIDPPLKWEPDACERLNDVPNIFLKRVVTGVVERAHSRGLTVVSSDFMDEMHWMN